MNKKNLPLKWKHTKINGKDNEYNVELDFIGDNPSWSNPSRREPTGGNIFGGRKEICICTFDVEEAVSNGVKIFDVHISGLGETDKSHDGTVHLPGTGG
ncbi:hypothetical protein [Ekhidna sp.]|uniref:hypothetical protein n=1 Tax=Ekhidna sp. TaxID=2608089 RepID=UPI0032F03E2C